MRRIRASIMFIKARVFIMFSKVKVFTLREVRRVVIMFREATVPILRKVRVPFTLSEFRATIVGKCEAFIMLSEARASTVRKFGSFMVEATICQIVEVRISTCARGTTSARQVLIAVLIAEIEAWDTRLISE